MVRAARSRETDYASALRSLARPVKDPADALEIDHFVGDARIVMLGESTHGTAEFYDWRRAISERLVRDHGFSFIAVEGDWPDCQRIHAHATSGRPLAREALAGYRRFPTWMWGNEEVLELVEWLRGHNDTVRLKNGRAGFHGLDVYSLQDSVRLVVEYVRRVDPAAADMVKHAYACFERFGDDPEDYARGTRWVPDSCQAEVVAALSHMTRMQQIYSGINPDHTAPAEAYFDATMNARVVRNAEAYYRTMSQGGAPSWNVRDRHMMETLQLLLEHYGPRSRAIVWAHNTHIGDYRATDMLAAGYVNIGGLAREEFGEEAVRLVGFSTHRGTVMAATEWGEEGQVMNVPEGAPDSLEDRLHALGMPRAIVPLRGAPEGTRRTLNEWVGHRAIGVVYHPRYEAFGNYVPTRLANRYDALCFIDETQAVHPLGIPVNPLEEPEAYPTGL